MKKILLASTILVGTAGLAAAGPVGGSGPSTGIDITGSAGFGMIYTGTWALNYYAGFDIAFTGETDQGIMFGTTVSVDARDATIDDSSVWISSNGIKLAVGAVDPVITAVVGGISDVGYSGLGVDNLAEGNQAADAADILVTGTFSNITVGASYDTGTTDFGIAASGTFSDYTIAAGYFNDGGNNEYTVKVGGTWGAFGANALYSADTTASTYNAGIDASYTSGAVTVTAAFGTANGTTNAYGLGVSYDLGGGASLDAGVASVAGATRADFGINMNF